MDQIGSAGRDEVQGFKAQVVHSGNSHPEQGKPFGRISAIRFDGYNQVTFPLTPALSLGEREENANRCDVSF